MDIYFKEEYAKLYENIENGKMEKFEYKSELGIIRNVFIKREIPTFIDSVRYYDLVTPYGFGGPIIIECVDDESKAELVKKYHEIFKEYCEENNIISEFIRFHPIIKNRNDFKDIYDTQYMRKTVGTNLKDYDDPFQSEFSKSCRKTVRRALRDGVTFEMERQPNNIDEFTNIYNSTMERNDAIEYYYFGQEYFNDIINNLKSNVVVSKAIYEGKTIASGLYFIFNNTIHAHLSGTLNEYLHLSPAYILKYGTTIWGKENGYEMIHYGGGTSNSEEDSLFKFKKRFARNTEFDFYIGKKIWNVDIYNKLCKENGIKENEAFFPAYRR